MQVITYQRLDGGVSVCHSVISSDDPPGFTEADALARALSKDIPPTASNIVVRSPSALPARRFRNAWRHQANMIGESLPDCRSLKLDWLRIERDRRLVASDPKMLRANEQGTAQEQADWKAYRQALRTLPATIQTDLQSKTTADEIDLYSPAWPVEPP